MSLLADLSWKENENLGLPELNRRAKIISDAIEALRAYQPSWETEVNLLREIGLERLNTALLPAFQQIIELTDLGALLSATSTSEVEIGGGTKTFVLPEAKRLSFAPTPFLIAYAESDYDLSMVGTVSSYDRDTGTLVILVEDFKGEGTFSEWTIGPIATTDDLEALRDAVQAAAADVAAKKAVVDTKHADVVAVGAYYYGARDTPPDDAPLGAQFLDTSQTPNLVKVLTEGGWAPTVTVSIGGSRQQVYTATEGQTGPFTVDGGFTNGSVNVDGIEFFDGNGVDLDPEARTFSFASPRAGGELVVFRGYLANDAVDTYTKAETYSKAEVDEKTATASQAEAEDGADSTKLMTPLRVRQAHLSIDGWEAIGDEIVVSSPVATIDWTDLAAFRDLYIEGFFLPSADGAIFLARTSTDNGLNYDSGALDYTYQRLGQNGGTIGGSNATISYALLCATAGIGNLATEGANLKIRVFSFNKARPCRFLVNGANVLPDATAYNDQLNLVRNQSTARNALRLAFNSGNIAAGSYCRLWGIRG